MSESGRIDLRVEDDSMFLSNNLPYVIRNVALSRRQWDGTTRRH